MEVEWDYPENTQNNKLSCFIQWEKLWGPQNLPAEGGAVRGALNNTHLAYRDLRIYGIDPTPRRRGCCII